MQTKETAEKNPAAAAKPHPLTEERALQLVERIIPYDADEASHALLELTEGLTYTDDPRDRESLSLAISRLAYSRTIDSHHAAGRFRERPFSE